MNIAQPVRVISVTVVCWAVALAGGALVVALAADANIYRCADGWTNRGQAQWFYVIAALVLTAPALGRAAWLLAGSEGSVRLRWAAAAVAVGVPIVAIALALGFLPEAPATGRCFD
jgi:hypothetical protein